GGEGAPRAAACGRLERARETGRQRQDLEPARPPAHGERPARGRRAARHLPQRLEPARLPGARRLGAAVEMALEALARVEELGEIVVEDADARARTARELPGRRWRATRGRRGEVARHRPEA